MAIQGPAGNQTQLSYTKGPPDRFEFVPCPRARSTPPLTASLGVRSWLGIMLLQLVRQVDHGKHEIGLHISIPSHRPCPSISILRDQQLGVVDVDDDAGINTESLRSFLVDSLCVSSLGCRGVGLALPAVCTTQDATPNSRSLMLCA